MLSSIVEHYTRLWEKTQRTQADTCRLCTHRRITFTGSLHCQNPNTSGGPVERVRSLGGACGPEAELFTFHEAPK